MCKYMYKFHVKLALLEPLCLRFQLCGQNYYDVRICKYMYEFHVKLDLLNPYVWDYNDVAKIMA